MIGGERRKPPTRWSDGHAGTWGPYWDVMFGGRTEPVTPWVNWKRGSTGVNVARLYWHQREHLRHAYQSVYGADPAAWPSQHPGVVLHDRAGCLRCHYLSGYGGYGLRPLDLAWRHETGGADHPQTGETDAAGM